MNVNDLIATGNDARARHDPAYAIQCYAQAFVLDPENSAAFNNYGNVIREMGYPQRAIPFLEHARILDPNSVTAEFNLSVAYLLMGDYEKGWPLYESRWKYEHLSDTKPKLPQPEWTGQDLNGKTILLVGEQGLGDQIQFARFIWNFVQMGAKVKLMVSPGIKPLFENSPEIVAKCVTNEEDPGEFDYWITMMSVPGRIGLSVKTIPTHLQYIVAGPEQIEKWKQLLGPKNKMRIGIAWSGRKDSWINQHKSMPVEVMAELVKAHPEYQWISLQVDATDEENAIITQAGATVYPGTVMNFADSGGLVSNLDLVISVDTAIAHLAGAMGRPTWIPLNSYGNCWRWLLNTDSNPWYPSVRLFRQPSMGDWTSVTKKIAQYLSWFKV